MHAFNSSLNRIHPVSQQEDEEATRRRNAGAFESGLLVTMPEFSVLQDQDLGTGVSDTRLSPLLAPARRKMIVEKTIDFRKPASERESPTMESPRNAEEIWNKVYHEGGICIGTQTGSTDNEFALNCVVVKVDAGRAENFKITEQFPVVAENQNHDDEAFELRACRILAICTSVGLIMNGCLMVGLAQWGSDEDPDERRALRITYTVGGTALLSSGVGVLARTLYDMVRGPRAHA